jgi:hypothetical protein
MEVLSLSYPPCIYRNYSKRIKLFDNRLKYVHFPMIEETFFREGEAVFILEFCARLTTWSKNDDELAIGDTGIVIPFRKICIGIILPPFFILKGGVSWSKQRLARAGRTNFS